MRKFLKVVERGDDVGYSTILESITGRQSASARTEGFSFKSILPISGLYSPQLIAKDRPKAVPDTLQGTTSRAEGKTFE